jgi:predicted metallopeptidase
MAAKITKKMLFMPSVALRTLADRIIRAYPEHFDHIELDRVYFCTEVNGKPSGANAVCHKLNKLTSDLLIHVGAEYDFIIAFFSDAVDGKSEKWFQILMFHELLHIGPDGKLVDHDIEEFVAVLDIAGHRWQSDKNLPDIIKKKIRLVA